MASRKKPEDKNLTLLRGLVSQPHNKKCFDCRQRGPTYVNMTIGAFVCTSCSGLLRGLNPPHRIKSISMATFNPQEIEFLQNHGNEVCRQSWLGLWNSQLPPEPETRDEQKVKDFLSKKYERRTWYTSQPRPKSPDPVPEAKPLKHLLGDGAPRMALDGQSNHNSALPSVNPVAAPRRVPAHQSHAPGLNLLGDLGADPFGSSGNAVQEQRPAASNVFDAFASSPTATASFTAFGQPPPQPQQPNAPFDAFASSPPRQSSGSFTAFSSEPGAFPGGQDLFSGLSASSSTGKAVNGVAGPQSSAIAPGDRYSALSDLDDMFRSSNTSSVFSSQPTNTAQQQHQQQHQQPPPQQRQQSSNSQPNPFMSPASGTSGIAMFQQQQQKAANPFHHGAAAQMQQQPAGAYAQSGEQQFAAANNASFAMMPRGWGGASTQQQPSSMPGAIVSQSMPFGNFPSSQQQMAAQPVGNAPLQQQQQFPGSMPIGNTPTGANQFGISQGFQQQPQGFQQAQQPQGFQQQPQGFQQAQQAQAFQQQQQAMAGGNVPMSFNQQAYQMQPQQMSNFQGNQFQAQQMSQMGANFNSSAFAGQQQQQQQPPQKVVTPQQFSGWGSTPNGNSLGMPQQQQHAMASQQRSSTNPFM